MEQEIEQTESVKELHEQIALKVFGTAERCPFLCPDCGSTHFGSAERDGTTQRYCHDEFLKGCRWHGDPIDALPDFSADMNHAMDVVDEMINKHDATEFEVSTLIPNSDAVVFWVSFSEKGKGDDYQLAKAICNAALAHLGSH